MKSIRVGKDINKKKNGRLSSDITAEKPVAKSNEFIIKSESDSMEFVTTCQIIIRNDA